MGGLVGVWGHVTVDLEDHIVVVAALTSRRSRRIVVAGVRLEMVACGWGARFRGAQRLLFRLLPTSRPVSTTSS